MSRSLLVGLLALAVAAPALAADEAPWCSTLRVVGEDRPAGPAEGTQKTAAPTSDPERVRTELTRLAVRWELDLRGALATGTLIETWSNTLGVPVSAAYRVYPAPGFELETTTAAIDGVDFDFETKDPEPETGPRGARGRKPLPGLKATEAFELPAGSLLEVRSTVRAPLGFEGGWYELLLPRLSSACRAQGSVEMEPEDEVPVPLELVLQVHHAPDAVEIESSTHAIARRDEPHGSEVTLAEDALVGEGPFRLRYRLDTPDAEEPTLGGWVSEELEDGSHDLLVVLTPPRTPIQGSAGDADVVFVIDTSGSMSGGKLAAAKAGLAATLENLDAEDSFALIRFSGDSSAFAAGLSPATERSEAKRWLESLVALGGTQLTDPLSEGLALAASGANHPLLVVLTDGAIHDAEKVESILGEDGGQVRVLFLGIGAEPQAAILERLARLARGEAAFAREAGGVEAALTRLVGSFSSPLAWDLRLEAPGAEIVSTWPKRIPDLYEGRPVSVFVRVRGPLPDELRLLGAGREGGRGLDRSVSLSDLAEAPGLRGPAAPSGEGAARR